VGYGSPSVSRPTGAIPIAAAHDLQLGLFDDDPTVSVGPVGPADVSGGVSSLADRLPRTLRLGTSSWSFPGWAGIVYDRTVSQTVLARHGLAAYARHPLLRTVGVDRGYYRPVPVDDLESYAAAVPEDFRFLVKADRILTSPTDPGAGTFRGLNPHFLDPTYAIEEVIGPLVEGLGSKAGPLVFQFEPIGPGLVGGRDAFAARLHGFLDALPPGPAYAVELRTPAFLTDAYARALEETGTSHCFTIHPAMTPLDGQLQMIRHIEQPVFVVRWMLHAGLKYEGARDRYEPFDRIVDEDNESLERLTVAVLDALIAERDAFVIANNKAEGSAPLSIFRLAERLARWDSEPEPPDS
jgi:uncharacterized protein YecE (DUF72 family)